MRMPFVAFESGLFAAAIMDRRLSFNWTGVVDAALIFGTGGHLGACRLHRCS